MIGRLENGALYACPKSGLDGAGVMHTNLPAYYERHIDTAAADGYYPVRYTDKPEGNYLPSWDLIAGEIVQVWTEYTPQPEPEPAPNPFQMRADIDYLAMMTDNDLGG